MREQPIRSRQVGGSSPPGGSTLSFRETPSYDAQSLPQADLKLSQSSAHNRPRNRTGNRIRI